MEHMNINIEYGAYFCFMLLMFKFEGHPGLGEILHLEDSRMLSKQPCTTHVVPFISYLGRVYS